MLNCDRARIADFTEQLDRSYAGAAARYARQQQARAPDPPAPGPAAEPENLVCVQDAVAALQALGCKAAEAKALISKVLPTLAQPVTAQTLTAAALRARH